MMAIAVLSWYEEEEEARRAKPGASISQSVAEVGSGKGMDSIHPAPAAQRCWDGGRRRRRGAGRQGAGER